MLHEYLGTFFPQAYRQRGEEARQEEEACDVASPQEIPLCSRRHGDHRDALGNEQDSCCRGSDDVGVIARGGNQVQHVPCDIQGPSSKDFACDACGMLVCRPCILNCGHVVCVHHHVPSEELSCCPKCQAKVAPGEIRDGQGVSWAVCTQLWDWMARAFPEEVTERIREVSDSLGVDADALMSPSPRMHVSDQQSGEEQEQGRVVGTRGESHEQGSVSDVYHEASLGRMDDFPHFGVGCDVCGQYPIRGERFKCLDCPESVGFDVCKGCKDSMDNLVGSDILIGRFNQKHQSDHRLELVPPVITKLHVLKEMHPELDYNRLISLIEMSWEDDIPDAQPLQHDSNQLNEVEQQQQQQEHDARDRTDQEEQGRDEQQDEALGGASGDDRMTDGSTMMRPRGPRPRYQ